MINSTDSTDFTDFFKLESLKIVFSDNSNAKNATIYGNGNNQVKVTVTAKVKKKKDNVESYYTIDELKNHISLIDYTSAEQIPSDSDNGWSASLCDKGYVNAIFPTDMTEDDGITEPELQDGPEYLLHMYLSSKTLSDGKDVAVNINIPDVGDFNTTKTGTDTKNGPHGGSGSVFNSPQMVHVKALRKIDYTNNENLNFSGFIQSSYDFENIVTDMELLKNWNHEAFNGDSSRFTAQISPADANFKFKKMVVTSNTNATAGFNIYGGACDGVYGVGEGVYDTNFIFVNKEKYGLNPNQNINTKDDYWGDTYSYHIGPKDGRHKREDPLPEGVISIRYWSHRINRGGLYQSGWSDANDKITIDVADDYGNESVISITWSKLRANFPHLEVNGIKI
ncbi:hypothetical protein RAS76_003294 [Salmonella enterica]|nr:hypothetical protein [Salmonella enterica]